MNYHPFFGITIRYKVKHSESSSPSSDPIEWGSGGWDCPGGSDFYSKYIPPTGSAGAEFFNRYARCGPYSGPIEITCLYDGQTVFFSDDVSEAIAYDGMWYSFPDGQENFG